MSPVQEKVLELLKKRQEFFSGEELSHHFKISRQALWKHIQEFKELGYDIAAVPHLGYKLVSGPDRLLPFEVSHGLDTKFIAKDIHYFDTVSSTMDIAMRLGIEGAAGGTLVLAEAQSKGRGRMGRSWLSLKYKGIYLSLLLNPKMLPNQSPMLTLLCAVSICEAIKKAADLDVKIKWPNDILIDNRKVGGILTELNAEMDAVRFVVIGIGLNVNNDKKSLIGQATSLKEEKGEFINRISLLQDVLRKIEKNYLVFQEKGPDFITERWRNYSITLGRRVKVVLDKRHLEGEAVNIDRDGALLLRKDSGIIERVTAGDVLHCR